MLLNPLVYLSEALRAALTPSLPHMSPLATLPTLALATLLFGTAAVRTFTRRVLL